MSHPRGVPLEAIEDGFEGFGAFQDFIYCPQGVSFETDLEGLCKYGGIFVLDSTVGGPDKGDMMGLLLDSGFYGRYTYGIDFEAENEEDAIVGELRGGNFTAQTVID